MSTSPSNYARHRPLLWLVSLAIFMQMLDSTIVNTALPAMAASLGESPLQMQSVVFSYALAVATFIPASGWIADRYGTRRTFLVAIILFTLGSLACALAQHLHQLVGARVLQGIGGAMLLPVGRLAVMRSVSREDFLRAMSFIAIPALVGPLIGPTLGGWLVEIASWHWVFLINLPIGVIGFIAAMKIMPDHYASHRTRFDLRGYVMLAFAMVVLSLALDGISGLGTPHALVMLMTVAGLAALVEVQYGPAHAVTLAADGWLAQWHEGDRVQVNSVHGQGIARLARGLRAEAVADDGLVEAARSLHHRFVLGVQWHPEWRVMQAPFYHAIFRAFGQACRQHQQNRLDSR